MAGRGVRRVATRLGAARFGAVGAVAAAVIAGGFLVAPGAGAQPALPPVTPEDLVGSVLARTDPGPFAGTVTLDNNLGLPALPDLPQAANGTSTARVWSGGERKGRVALPSDGAERTLVSDGTTHWAWNSADRTVVRGPVDADRAATPADPTGTATKAIADLRASSTVAVDGTATVAGRGAYELVLTPAPTERTLLREVRVAVDAEKRIPLRLTVLAIGSAQPALQVGFSDLAFGPQDPALFTFTPPAGATVTDAPARDAQARPDATTVGDGWDAVRIMRRTAATTPGTPTPNSAAPNSAAPDGAAPDSGAPGAPDLSAVGTPVSGPWGKGRLITASVGSAIVTDDGRVAAGAVPEQVLTEALAR